ncbi:MAG: hypothetical protein IPP44_30755 [Ideonella sp.]|nr:hypothetical protein [Ideonella sp.]
MRAINDALDAWSHHQRVVPYTFVIPLSESITITQMHAGRDDGNTYW